MLTIDVRKPRPNTWKWNSEKYSGEKIASKNCRNHLRRDGAGTLVRDALAVHLAGWVAEPGYRQQKLQTRQQEDRANEVRDEGHLIVKNRVSRVLEFGLTGEKPSEHGPLALPGRRAHT